MNRTRISISTITITTLIVITTIVFFIFGTVFYDHQKKAMFKQLDTNLTITADQLAAGLSIAIWNFDEDEIIKLIESGLLDPNIHGIQVDFNDDGTRVLSIRREGNSLKKSAAHIIPRPDDIIFDSQIDYGKEKVGHIVMFVTPDLVYEELKKEMTLFICFILISTLLIVIGLYYIFKFIIIDPLQILEQYALTINLEKYRSDKSIKKRFFKEPENLGISMQKMLLTITSNYEKLGESENRFRETADLLPQTVFEIDKTGRLSYMNQTGMKLFGLTKEDVERGIYAPDVIHADDLERALKTANEFLSGETKIGGREYKAKRHDGTTFPFLMYSSYIKKGDEIVGVRSIGIDMTEQRNNEAAINQLMQENFRKEKELEKLKAVALLEGQENERLRISREIHDGVGQMMTAIKISSDSIDLTNHPGAEQKKLEYTRSLIYDVIAELRQVSSDLSPTFLYDYGLYLAVNQLVINISKISQLKIEFNSDVEMIRYSSLVEITFYRIIQEAVNNTMKYSGAKNLTISLMQDAEFLELNINDDGKGFDLSSKEKGAPYTGNGLKNMSSRANLIGASFQINSQPGKGCCINLQIPLENTHIAANQN